MNAREARKYGFEHGYDAADYLTKEDIEEIRNRGLDVVFSEIYYNWVQTDWYAYNVVPEMKTEAAWEAFEEGVYEGFLAGLRDFHNFIEGGI